MELEYDSLAGIYGVYIVELSVGVGEMKDVPRDVGSTLTVLSEVEATPFASTAIPFIVYEPATVSGRLTLN